MTRARKSRTRASAVVPCALRVIQSTNAWRVIQSAWPPSPEDSPNEREGSPVGLAGRQENPPEVNRVFGGDPSRSLQWVQGRAG